MIYKRNNDELVLIQDDTVFCVSDTTSDEFLTSQAQYLVDDEVYQIDGRIFDCCSMPLKDFELNGHETVSSESISNAEREALQRTIAYNI